MPMKNKRILLLALVLALMLGVVWWWHGSGRVSSSSARVQAYSLLVSPRVDGYVVDVAVREGDRVKAGQTLLRLDSAALQTALAREQAKLALLGAPPRPPADTSPVNLEQARKDETMARQEVERLSTFQASTAVKLSRLRSQGANARTLRAAEENDRAARSALANAKDQLEEASKNRARMEQQRSAIRSAGAAPEAQLALYAAQEAAVRQARQDLAAAELKAPADGVVLFRDANPGQMLRRGDKALVLLPSGPDHIWVSAAFSKAAASRLRPGQFCKVTVEGYTGPELTGVIGGIIPRQTEGNANGRDPDEVTVHVTLASYDPAAMPLLPVNEKATVTVNTRAAAPEKTANATVPGGKKTTAPGGKNATRG